MTTRREKMEDAAKRMGDALALRGALIDQLQATLDANKHWMTEEQYQERQAPIDAKRFDLEMDRLVYRAKIGSIPGQ
jgi:hypothetical protein